MDPEQTFLRVHARVSGVLARLLTPKFRAVLEYLCLFNALMLLALLVVMHVNFVAQPACSAEFLGADVAEAQLVQIKVRTTFCITQGVWFCQCIYILVLHFPCYTPVSSRSLTCPFNST